MTMLIREGTLEEALQVVARVTEFSKGETVDSMTQRLEEKNSLILVAEKKWHDCRLQNRLRIRGWCFL